MLKKRIIFLFFSFFMVFGYIFADCGSINKTVSGKCALPIGNHIYIQGKVKGYIGKEMLDYTFSLYSVLSETDIVVYDIVFKSPVFLFILKQNNEAIVYNFLKNHKIIYEVENHNKSLFLGLKYSDIITIIKRFAFLSKNQKNRKKSFSFNIARTKIVYNVDYLKLFGVDEKGRKFKIKVFVSERDKKKILRYSRFIKGIIFKEFFRKI